MLKELLTRFRKHPVIKQALSRGEMPSPQEKYDALMTFRDDPVFMKFSETMMEGGRWHAGVFETPFQDRTYKKYLNNGGTRQSDNYQDYIEEVNKRLSRAARGKLSPHVRKALIAWVHNNTRSAGLHRDDLKELLCIENIRPDQPVKLYRGLLFSKYMMNGEHPRSASIFINALLHGHTELMVNSDRPSSWTISADIANRFAKNKAAGSEYSAMLNWLHHAKEFIQGELGLVISAEFKPHDIACEISKVDLGHLTHGDEGEMIVMPGNYTVKIEHIYTKQGEITADQFAEFIEQYQKKAA